MGMTFSLGYFFQKLAAFPRQLRRKLAARLLKKNCWLDLLFLLPCCSCLSLSSGTLSVTDFFAFDPISGLSHSLGIGIGYTVPGFSTLLYLFPYYTWSPKKSLLVRVVPMWHLTGWPLAIKLYGGVLCCFLIVPL